MEILKRYYVRGSCFLISPFLFNMIGIYKITNPKGKIYIGQSINIEKRSRSYSKLQCKGQLKLYNSLTKYGFSEHIFEVVEECSVEKLNERERHWQDYYNVLSKNGLNCNLTKAGNISGQQSQEVRNKIREGQIRIGNRPPNRQGTKHTQKTKDAIAEGNRGIIRNVGRRHSKETREKLSKAHLGMKHTEEAKTKQALAKLGKRFSDKHKQAIAKSHIKYENIKRYDLTGVLVKVYNNIGEAVKEGYDFECVRRCLLGKAKKHKKYIWTL